MKRQSTIARKTFETDVKLSLRLDDLTPSIIDSGVPFFNHMLSSLSKHGRFFIDLKCVGDIEIDDHHSVEDIGIVLGQAFREALGDKAGIRRFGNAAVPMDESLSVVSIDLSGRPYFKYSGPELSGYIAKYSEELTLEFFRAFTDNAGINLHIETKYGDNRHHIHESIFKAAAVALYHAAGLDSFLQDTILSTKGSI